MEENLGNNTPWLIAKISRKMMNTTYNNEEVIDNEDYPEKLPSRATLEQSEIGLSEDED